MTPFLRSIFAQAARAALGMSGALTDHSDTFAAAISVASSPSPAPSSSKLTIGGNLGGFSNLTRGQGPINLAKASYPPADLSGNILPSSSLDAYGMPTVDFTLAIQPPQTTSSSTCLVTFPGIATLGFRSSFDGGSTWSGQSHNISTDTTTATLTVPAHTLGGTGLNLQLSFTNTQRTQAAAAGTGLSAIDVRPTGYAGSTNTWSDEYKAYLTDVKSFRLMDMLGTNNDQSTVNWSDRSVNVLSNSRFEDLVALANETNKALWWNIPALASDGFVTSLASFLNANTSQVVRIEYVNEYFNGAFTTVLDSVVTRIVAPELKAGFGGSASRGVLSASRTSGVTTVVLNYTPDVSVGTNIFVTGIGNSGGGGAYVVSAVNKSAKTISFSQAGSDGSISLPGSSCWFMSMDTGSTLHPETNNYNLYGCGGRHMIRRLMQISDLFRSVVGDAKMMTQFRPVFMDQSGNDFTSQLDSYAALISSRAGFSDAISSKIWAIGMAPYHSVDASPAGGPNLHNDISPGVTHTSAEYLTAFGQSIAYVKQTHKYEACRNTATRWGVAFECYEGGAEMSPYELGTANDTARNDARNTTGYGGYVKGGFNDMELGGMDAFHWFNLGLNDPFPSSDRFAYGVTYDYTAVTPTWQAIKDYNAQAANAKRNTVTAVGTTVIDCINYVDNYPTSGFFTQSTSKPGLASPYGQVLPFIIWADGPCTKTLTINASCIYSPNGMKVEINNVVVQNITQMTITANLTTYVNLAPVSVTLKQGWNALRILVNESHGGGNNEQFNTFTFS